MVQKDTQVVELTPYEAAAYWWIKRIKNVSEDILKEADLIDNRRTQFAQLFNYEKLKAKGYRRIYLELAKRIEERCNGKKVFSLRTSASYNGHKELTDWLTEIMGVEVPNITIGDLNSEDVLISVKKEDGKHLVYVGDTDRNGIRRVVGLRYKVNPVICGSKKENKKDDNDSQSEEMY